MSIGKAIAIRRGISRCISGAAALCLTLALGSLGNGLPPAVAQDLDVARGIAIVESKCARCHATGRADASPNPKAPPFRDVGKFYPLEHLAEALAEGIMTGGDMPEFKFNPNDVEAIIDYLNAMATSR